VAIVFDWDSWWTSELDSHPTSDLRYRSEALDWYSALLDLGIRADVIPVGADLAGYAVVIAPVLHVVPAELTERLTRFVAQGGHLATTYFSGTVDEHDHVWLGGYPGALRDLLGIRVEEFDPLPAGESVELDNELVGTLWSERIEWVGPDTEVLAWYKTGEQAGRPAITRRPSAGGSATYVSTRLGPRGLQSVLVDLLAHAGVSSELPEPLHRSVELTVRSSESADYWFLVNRTSEPVDVAGVAGEVLAGNAARDGEGWTLPARGVVVLQRPRTMPVA
jgi:beta-galactosidase